MLYFAYGSNMLTARLRQRTPSATALTLGYLQGHILKCNKKGRDGSGKGNIELTGHLSDWVYGVVYQLDPLEKPQLDRAESLGYGYAQTRVEVVTPQGAMAAWTYYALRIDNTLQPYDWYKAFLVHGAQENHLPNHYLTSLAALKSITDPNPVRRQQNLDLLNWLQNIYKGYSRPMSQLRHFCKFRGGTDAQKSASRCGARDEGKSNAVVRVFPDWIICGSANGSPSLTHHCSQTIASPQPFPSE